MGVYGIGSGETFKTQLRKRGLAVVEVAADGNCLFRALAEQVNGNEDAHAEVRANVLNFMEINRGDFEPFNETGLPFDEYLAKMKQPGGGWGGEMELYAASRLFRVNIRIYQDSVSENMNQYIDLSNNDHDARIITLSYHNGNHYNSVRPLDYVIQKQPLCAKSKPKDAKEAEEMDASCCCASILLQCKKLFTKAKS